MFLSASVKMRPGNSLILWVLLCPLFAFGQTISNIRIESTHDKVFVVYDLESYVPQSVDVVFFGSSLGRINPDSLSGDLHQVTAGTNRRIEWEALKYMGSFSDQMYVELSLQSRWQGEDVRGWVLVLDGEEFEVAREDLEPMSLDSARIACASLGFGWRLPTDSELNHIFQELYLKDIGGLSEALYWSGTEDHETMGRVLNFYDGEINYNNRQVKYRCRPVRSAPK